MLYCWKCSHKEIINRSFHIHLGPILNRTIFFILTRQMYLCSSSPLFIDIFRGILRNRQAGQPCVMPKIHVYGFSKAEDPEYDFNEVSVMW
jgi:hypothetical protein